MISLTVLKTKEARKVTDFIEERFGVKVKLDYVFFKNNKDRIYIINKDVMKLRLNDFRVDTLGFYFCSVEKDGYRLSFDGAMMIGSNVKKNFVVLNDKDKILWMKGEDVPFDHENGYVLVRYKDDFLGCGKIKDGLLLNFVPNPRRLR